MKTIHLISHTHWDREWYLTFQQFRLKLVHLVDGLLDILSTNRNYKHFMLDGQTIVLDDYLQMRPEAESTLKKYIQSGRVLIGPWHILPDMFLVSPEAHIRNLLLGDRIASRFGPKMMIGYMPDSFGHIGQMPQILQGFGINNACLWRGLDEQPPEFWWQAPDGTRVLMLYLRDSYGNGANLNASDARQFTEQIEQAADSLAPHSAASDLLVMYGTDHMEPPVNTAQAIKSANRMLKDYRVLHSTLPAYLSAIQSTIKNRKIKLPVITGELRSSKRSHLLPGVLSTRIWIKQSNHACENLLEKWAEPFSTFAWLTSEGAPQEKLRHPSSILSQAWMLLLQNHPHDSICGCSIDQVHDEMRPRFDQVEQIGEEITQQSLEILANKINTHSSKVDYQSAVVVFNPLSSAGTGIASIELTLPPGIFDFELVDESGNVIPHQSADGQPIDLVNVQDRREELGGLLALVHEGRAPGIAIQDIHFARNGAILHVEAIFSEKNDPNLEIWHHSLEKFQEYLDDSSIQSFHIHARLPDSAKISFVASDVPAMGWKTFFVRSRESQPLEVKVPLIVKWLAPLSKIPLTQKFLERLSNPKTKQPYIIENEFLKVELNLNDRTLSVTEKKSGKILHGLNRFEDSGDCGDEYNFSPPPSDLRVETTRLLDVTITRGPVQQIMTAALVMKTPAGLSADRKSRSTEMVETAITTTITLTTGVPRADIHTRVHNRARDHRLRVHFPASFRVDSANHDGHFEIVKRPVGIPSYDETWAEAPRPETHQRVFTSISDGNETLTIANRGLPEVEVIRDDHGTGSVIALTLLRCVGWLSRDDFTTRKNHAGPFLETPLAQMPGEWEFDYSIIPGLAGQSAYQEAWSFDTPLRSATTDIHPGGLSSSGSFLHVDDPRFVISTVKETEDGRGWIVRGYNTSGEEIPVTLQPWRKFRKAARTNLAEKPVGALKVGKLGDVHTRIMGHEIATFLFQE